MTSADRIPHRAFPMPATAARNGRALLRQAALAFCLACLASPALADDDCDVPVGQWQSRDAVREMAAARGWQVRRIKIDDGCYEIRGIDTDGRAFKARIDPQSLAIVKIRHKQRDSGERRSRDGDGKGHGGRHDHGPPAAQPDAVHPDGAGDSPSE